MTRKRTLRKFLLWPHSLYVDFLVGLLLAWPVITILNPWDEYHTEFGKHLMILAFGLLGASGATLDLPTDDPDRQELTSKIRRTIRGFLIAGFILLMMYSWMFEMEVPYSN